MKGNRIFGWVGMSLLGALLSLATPARASFVAIIDFTGSGSAPTGSLLSLGYSFTVGAQPFTVTGVGLDVLAPPSGQDVRIYQDGTSVNLLVQPILGSDPTDGSGRYQYVVLTTPLVLTAGTTYDIVADLGSTAQVACCGVSAVSSDPNITFGASRASFTANTSFPTIDVFGVGPYFGPVFTGTEGGASVVPEPASFVLAGIGAAGLIAGRWRRRRCQVSA